MSISHSSIPHLPPNLPTSIPTSLKVYNTPEGFSLARKILAQTLPFEPHDYQVEGVCAALNGCDLIATMATRSGKTGFFIMLMLIMHAIADNKTLALSGKSFAKDPAMIVICPTKALQEDMVSDLIFCQVNYSLKRHITVTKNDQTRAQITCHQLRHLY